MNTDVNKIALDAIAESLATGGAYVNILETPGLIDALQARADDWAEQTHGIGISGREESADGSIIEYWNVFVTYQPKAMVELTHDELLSVLMAVMARERDKIELQERFGTENDELTEALGAELRTIRAAIKKLEDAHSELL